MVGILICTHGNFGEGIIKSAEIITGPQENVLTLGLCQGDSIEKFTEKVTKSIILLDKGEGVLVFADLFGASPYNAAAISSKKVGDTKFRCIAGINFPMLLEAIIMRDSNDLDQLTSKALKAGVLGIKELFNEIYLYNDKNK